MYQKIIQEDFGEGPYGNIHKNVVLKNSPLQGKGLFATLHIKAGTIVWYNHQDGPMTTCYSSYTFKQIREELTAEQREIITRYGSQLDEDSLIGPTTEEEVDLDYSNYWNHSCDPNTLPLNENCWIAVRDILPDEELTIDYITFDSNEYSYTGKCNCGSANCRTVLSSMDYILEDIQKRYKGHFVGFIESKLVSTA